MINKNFIYRKACTDDLEAVADLVTNLLGTCNIWKDKNMKDEYEIINANKKEIEKDITKYYVCEIENKIIGACWISDIKNENNYGLDLWKYREILYLVVDNKYQKMGIWTELLKKCIENINEKIIYEARWDKDEVNSKALLEKLDFKLLKDLGDTYYKDHNYCAYCVNRDKNCNKCKAELWIKE